MKGYYKILKKRKQIIMSEKTKQEIKPFLVRLDTETKIKAKAKADEQNRSLNSYIVNLVKCDLK